MTGIVIKQKIYVVQGVQSYSLRKSRVLGGRVTRIFEKWAPAKLETTSVENGTKTSTATDSPTDGEDYVSELLPIYSNWIS